VSRIAERFISLRGAGRKALVPFITAGDPAPAVTVPLMHAMVSAGADILELGVPFSDPMADGPVIQQASERALRHHVSLRDVLAMVAEFRSHDAETPVVLMGYLNPIEVMGYERFVQHAAEAGVDGVLTVDMPPEEAADYVAALTAARLDPVFLLAPTSTGARIERISAMARGFVYYVSLKGVTGAASLDVQSVEEAVTRIRAVTGVPIGVGFGIRDAETAARISRVADAVVVGSAVVGRIAAAGEVHEQIIPAVAGLLAEMRQAIDEAAEQMPVNRP